MRINRFHYYISEKIGNLNIDDLLDSLNKENIKHEIRDGKVIINGLDYDINRYDSVEEIMNEISKDNKDL